jgi:predicted membrane channel-forming protein YqfA (hemolysin III family)
LLTVNFPENDLIKYIATGLISGILILSLFKYLLQRNMIIAVILYLLGVICWQIDGRRIFCDPLSILQFHSLWHICVALAGLFIVREVVRLGKGE